MQIEQKPMLRATDETRYQLKVIAALTRETMQAVVARLVKTEFERVNAEPLPSSQPIIDDR